ncbi:hypothetical protein MKY41_01925 [Sporosarcina sp. FSL W7-1349]|uniref:hypothetical protein n=1 Tax=Sporosarcina sp. FSL W7-1349 TaxID=2921561 RepID=UPI0030F7A544
MSAYFIVIILAIVSIPILFWYSAKDKSRKQIVLPTFFGLSIAIIGIFLQQNFSLYYAILAMAGLVFAISVLLAKRQERVGAEKLPPELKEPAVVLPTESIRVEEEVAATTSGEADDEFTLTPLEDDLDRWMAADQKDISSGQERKGERDEQ